MTWLTVDDPRLPGLWPGSLDVDTDTLTTTLAAARAQCEAFGTTLTAPEDPPDNYVIAQALQARALTRSGLAGSGDQIGLDGMSVTVFPMDWTVKALLRPKRGRPAIA